MTEIDASVRLTVHRDTADEAGRAVTAPWFSSDYTAPDRDGEALPSILDPVEGDHERALFLSRRVAVLEDGNRRLTDLIVEAIVCLRERGLHEAADRIEREASPF